MTEYHAPGIDIDAYVRSLIAALESILDGDDAAARLVACGRAAVNPLREFLIGGRPVAAYQSRARAVRALSGLGADDVLVEYLRHRAIVSDAEAMFAEQTARSIAARSLTGSTVPGTVGVLLQVARAEHLAGALEALTAMAPESAVEVLIAALDDDFARPVAHVALVQLDGIAHTAVMDAAVSDVLRHHGRRAALDVLLDAGITAADWRRLEPLLDEDDAPRVCAVALLGQDLTPDPARIVRRMLSLLPLLSWEWLGAAEQVILRCANRAGASMHVDQLSPPDLDRADIRMIWRRIQQALSRAGSEGTGG
jgi:hypothetical protein